MEGKRYIVVQNAIRERITSDTSTSRLTKMSYYYRKNALGLIHPAISDFLSKPRDTICIIDPEPGEYDFGPRDRHVLMAMPEKPGYLIETFREGEFSEIEGSDWPSVWGGIKAKSCDPKWPEKHYNMTWRALEAFDLLMLDRIGEIPLHTAPRYVSGEDIKLQEKYFKAMRDHRFGMPGDYMERKVGYR